MGHIFEQCNIYFFILKFPGSLSLHPQGDQPIISVNRVPYTGNQISLVLILFQQQLLLFISHSIITSVVKICLWQAEDSLITQNDMEEKVKIWQSKLCFTISFFFPSSCGCGNTQIDTLQHENSTLKFSFVPNSNKKTLSMPCHFWFGRKRTNKLLPLGHLWQWARRCQLLLKAIHISGPKISFKITVFCIHVAGCQL